MLPCSREDETPFFFFFSRIMTQINETYRCPLCGNTIEVTSAGTGELVCCGKPMMNLRENTQEAAVEKHIPVVEKTGDGSIRVVVGEVEHPMDDDHYIGYIEVLFGNKILRADLSPGDKPVANFTLPSGTTNITARAWCNLHGMWKAEVEV
jgi:superoxide reductase